MSLYERAKRGEGQAMFEIGSACHKGEGVPMDFAMAKTWFGISRDVGHSGGPYGLAEMYLQGSGFPVDYHKAAELLKESKSRGGIHSGYLLGTLYEEGKLGRGREGEAAECYAWAGPRSHAAACMRLGGLYERGAGVPKDEVKKYFAFKAKQGKPVPKDNIVQPPVEQERGEQTAPPEESAPPRKSLKDLLKENDDYNREVQGMMSDRVKKTNGQLSEAMQTLAIIAQDYGIEVDDLSKLNLAELRQKIESDPNRASVKNFARENGVDSQTAQQIMNDRRTIKQQRAILDEQQRNVMLQNHYMNLQAQARELKKEFPDFDLDKALQNEGFYNDTLPGERTKSVKQAYYANFGDDIIRSTRANTAKQTAQAASNAVRSGRTVPSENGTVQRAPTNVKPTLYSQLSPEQKKEWEKRARAGAYFK